MKKRWLLNLMMLAVVAGLVAFLYLRPKANNDAPSQNEVSHLKLADFTQVKVEFSAQVPTSIIGAPVVIWLLMRKRSLV